MKIQVQKIEQHEGDRLARSLLDAAARAFEDPKVQAEFKAWQKARKQKEALNHGAH